MSELVKKEVVKSAKRTREDLLDYIDKCLDDDLYLAGNPDRTFTKLEQANSAIGRLLTVCEKDLERESE